MSTSSLASQWGVVSHQGRYQEYSAKDKQGGAGKECEDLFLHDLGSERAPEDRRGANDLLRQRATFADSKGL